MDAEAGAVGRKNMNDERLEELRKKYKDRNLLEELGWGTYAHLTGYTNTVRGEFINWICNAAYREIKRLRSEMPKWIPCSGRFPHAEYGESGSVLCCLENGEQKVLYFDGGNWCYPTGEPYVWINHKNGWHNRVVAWMPLPEPYKGGAE